MNKLDKQMTEEYMKPITTDKDRVELMNAFLKANQDVLKRYMHYIMWEYRRDEPFPYRFCQYYQRPECQCRDCAGKDILK